MSVRKTAESLPTRRARFSISDRNNMMSGGFGLCGIAENCIDAIAGMDVRDLTVISNNIGNSGRGLPSS